MGTVTVYRSSDTGAPTLSGTAGALVSVLDACLVNGYGTQTAAGWTKAFSGTNQGAYRNSPTDGTGFYLNVNDNAPAVANEARMTGFETMSAIGTGTGQFPTSSQLAIGSGAVVCRKSATANATARVWTLIADDTVFYFCAESGDLTNPVVPLIFAFGDIFAYRSGDAYRALIIGRQTENSSLANYENFPSLNGTATLTTALAGHYMPRTWTGVGGSLPVGKHTDQCKSGGTSVVGFMTAPSFFPYPNGPDGGLYLAPVWIAHNNAVRGYLKGVWAPLHHQPLNHDDTYSGTGNLSGKSFLVQSTESSTDLGQVHFETSSTWS